MAQTETTRPENTGAATATGPAAEGPQLEEEHFHIAHADRSDRFKSFNPDDFPIPTGSGEEEDWRFTPMDRIEPFIADGLAGPAAPVSVDCTGGATVEEVGREDSRLGTVGIPDDRAAALAYAAFHRSHVVTMHGGEHSDVVLGIDAPAPMNTSHTRIIAEKHATGTVVLEHTGAGNLSETVEISVGDEADITVVSVQEQERSAKHHSSQRMEVGRNAKLRHIVVTIGGDLVRITSETSFTGPGGEVNLLGAYITEAGEHQEHRVFVDHQEPNCVSRCTYKGALQGQDAHSVWIGDVLIGAGAAQTDTYELNRNLVLTEGTKADSVPNLEILTGDIVGAGHASATGKFDEEQLFYLMARGIPADVARRLVVRGFFAELIVQIEVESVREKLMAAIERELDLMDSTGTEIAEEIAANPEPEAGAQAEVNAERGAGTQTETTPETEADA
ncbi:Fe-S cluster assembly protein SufD [Actinobaculum suis]|uniref:Fe-S cluster assembly protein SufD n=1 Tax=Actinobaculum suis TaxID=1657 RepID=UPI0009F5E594|nr:Fe-S cluster assembly protein SufD [Actinobaculum suis]